MSSNPIRPAEALARIPTAEQLAGFAEDPLTQLPPEWRPAVWDFWAFFSDALTNQLALCTRLRRWIAADELTLAEALRAFDAMMSPGRAGGFRWPNQVLGGLSDEIEANRKADIAKRVKRVSDQYLAMIINTPRELAGLSEAFPRDGHGKPGATPPPPEIRKK